MSSVASCVHYRAVLRVEYLLQTIFTELVVCFSLDRISQHFICCVTEEIASMKYQSLVGARTKTHHC